MAVQHVGQLVVLFAGLLQAGFALTHAKHVFFDGNFQLADTALLVRLFGPQGSAAQQRQLAFQAILLLFELLVTLGGFRLALEAFELFIQLFANIVQALQVLLGAPHAVFGFPTALFVLGNPRGFFEGGTQVVRARFDQPRDHPLADNGVGARA